MRVLVVSESPPTDDPRDGNGSTMIPASVIPRLGADVEVDLAYVADRPAGPSAAVAERCDRMVALDVRSARLELLAMPVTRLPRGSWKRTAPGSIARVTALASRADVVYVHGLHAFSLVADVPCPVLAHEIDPWSVYWEERAARQPHPARRRYDRVQARRAFALERRMAARAETYVVVSPADATLLSHRLQRVVHGVPNGVTRAAAPAGTERSPGSVVFAGTLDYPPNVAAVRTLCLDVFPRIRERVPSAHLLVAGRRPLPEVQALAGDGIEIAADVPDLGAVLRRSEVAVFPGEVGRGTKNSVLEAMAAGCAVVATPSSARSIEPGPHLTVRSSAGDIAAAVVDLLDDRPGGAAAGEAARAFAEGLPTWDETAGRYQELLAAAASATTRPEARR